MVFLGCVQDKTLSGHVIKTIQLSTSGTNTCQQMCFIEANCMSYNIGPIEGDQRSCELNDADNVLDHGDVVAKDGFEFCTFKVGIHSERVQKFSHIFHHGNDSQKNPTIHWKSRL